MTETHKARLLREAAERAAEQAAAELQNARAAERRETERAFRIAAEAAIRQVWEDLLEGQSAAAVVEEIGFNGLIQIINRTWMKEFLRAEDARVAARPWKT